MSQPEAWLRGPLDGVDPWLMPAAHALVQAADDLEIALGLSVEQVWVAPGGAASVGFHLQHIAGSIDRLLTYARGASLDERQRRVLAGEATPGEPPASAHPLVREARIAIGTALDVIRATPVESLQHARSVGRQALPTTVFGLLVHIAEHTQRHVGQVITTAKIVRGLRLA